MVGKPFWSVSVFDLPRYNDRELVCNMACATCVLELKSEDTQYAYHASPHFFFFVLYSYTLFFFITPSLSLFYKVR